MTYVETPIVNVVDVCSSVAVDFVVSCSVLGMMDELDFDGPCQSLQSASEASVRFS